MESFCPGSDAQNGHSFRLIGDGLFSTARLVPKVFTPKVRHLSLLLLDSLMFSHVRLVIGTFCYQTLVGQRCGIIFTGTLEAITYG
jgi:hypothetical protein